MKFHNFLLWMIGIILLYIFIGQIAAAGSVSVDITPVAGNPPLRVIYYADADCLPGFGFEPPYHYNWTVMYTRYVDFIEKESYLFTQSTTSDQISREITLSNPGTWKFFTTVYHCNSNGCNDFAADETFLDQPLLKCVSGYKLNETGSPLEGWTITLSNETFTINTTTDAAGSYAFCGLYAGTYTVTETMQGGWIALSPATGYQSVTLSTSDVMNINFTNKQALVNFTFSPEKIRITDNVTFDASESVNMSEDILFWEFGDGQTDLSGSPVICHNYAKPGIYTVNLTVYYPSGYNSRCSKIINITIPVILVHGFQDDAETCWGRFESILEGEGYQVINFDYGTTSGFIDPSEVAKWLKADIDFKRYDLSYNGQEYKGKYDIVCHSMGALVTRWYMEELDGGKNIRQWIGVAPVNHGSATADFAEMAPDSLKFLLVVIEKGSIFHLRTDSPVVKALDNNQPYPGVKYRIIMGYNGYMDPLFFLDGNFRGLFGGKTWAMIKLYGIPTYYLTWLGDGIVANEQSKLFWAETDSLSGYDHFMTNKPLVMNLARSYIQNISRPSTNFIPSEEDYWQENYINNIADYWEGQLKKFGDKLILAVIISKEDPAALIRINWLGSDVNMTLISPNGEIVGPDSDQVTEYVKTNTTIYYLITNPEPGEWKAEIDPVDIPPEGEPFTFVVFVSSSLTMRVGTTDDSIEYSKGESPVITATIRNNTQPVIGARVWVNVTNPDNSVNTLIMKDDAAKGDMTANDGIYSVALPLTQSGYYSCIVTTNGTSSEPFQRTNELILHSIGNTITIISPDGGETYYLGSTLPISWAYAGNPGTTVNIEVIKGGSILKTLTGIPIGSGGSGSYNVTIPSSTPLGSDYKIRVTSSINSFDTDISDTPFAISGPTITIVSPNGGEKFNVGSSLQTNWTYTGNPGTSVNIEVLKGTSILKTISGIPSGSGGSGSYSVTIPASTPLGSDYKIRITSTSYPTYTDTSDGPFTIGVDSSSSIIVTVPNGGENWVQGSSQTIQWTYAGSPGTNVNVEVLRDTSIIAVIPGISIGTGGSGSFSLTIPYSTPFGANYRIRVTSASNPAYTDTSNGLFTISPAIHVTTPNGGENYKTGSSLSMIWTYGGNPGTTVNIEVLKGSSVLKTLTSIPIGSSGSGSYSVPIPASTPLGSDYKIRVTSASYAACTDTSDAPFTISAPG